MRGGGPHDPGVCRMEGGAEAKVAGQVEEGQGAETLVSRKPTSILPACRIMALK